jgi:hypothetical protein
LLLFSAVACAQYIPAYAKLTDGTGNVSKTAYLHFELQNSHLEALKQDNKHPNIQSFGAAQSGVYYGGMGEHELREQANDQLGRMVAILPAGSTHDAAA